MHWHEACHVHSLDIYLICLAPTAVKNDALDCASYYFDSGEDLQGHLRLKVKVKDSAHTKFHSYDILLLSPTPSATIS